MFVVGSRGEVTTVSQCPKGRPATRAECAAAAVKVRHSGEALRDHGGRDSAWRYLLARADALAAFDPSLHPD